MKFDDYVNGIINEVGYIHGPTPQAYVSDEEKLRNVKAARKKNELSIRNLGDRAQAGEKLSPHELKSLKDALKKDKTYTDQIRKHSQDITSSKNTVLKLVGRAAPVPPSPETQTAGLSKYTKYALPAAAAVGGLYVGKKALDWVTGKKKKKKKNNEV